MLTLHVRQPLIRACSREQNSSSLTLAVPSSKIRARLNQARVDLQLRVTLQSTANWVTCPGHLLLMHGGRGFNVSVDPKKCARCSLLAARCSLLLALIR